MSSSPGAPTRDVLLVSAIITVSLSVTILLCGLCHWCQRKLVRPLPPAPNSCRLVKALLSSISIARRWPTCLSSEAGSRRTCALRWPGRWPRRSVWTPRAHTCGHSWRGGSRGPSHAPRPPQEEPQAHTLGLRMGAPSPFPRSRPPPSPLPPPRGRGRASILANEAAAPASPLPRATHPSRRPGLYKHKRLLPLSAGRGLTSGSGINK